MIAFRLAPTILAIIAAAALVFVFATSNAQADSLYTPTSTLRLCNALDPSFPDAQLAGNAACTDTLAAGAVTPTTLTSDLAATNVYHESQVAFTPAAATIAGGGSMPVGEKIGGVRAALTYGLNNNPCATTLTTDFVLYNVALPNNPGDPRASTNIAHPRSPGFPDRFGRWQIGSPAVGANNVIDANADGRADSTTLAIQNYPSILLDAFDPDFVPGNDGPLVPLVPLAVYGALSQVSSEWRIHYIVQFAAGQLTTLPGPYAEMTSAMGQPAVVVTGDPRDGLGAISPITDTCAPATTTTMLLGQTPNGHQRYANPSPAGTHFTLVYNRSLRDLDQDGFENALDTCPKNVDTGSPKTGTGDTDGDGIDNACDTAGAGNDTEADGFVNRQDNCPNDPNGGASQVDGDVASFPNDLGPRRDDIGDACDTGTVVATVNNRPVTFTLSPTVSNGRYHTQTQHIPRCYGSTDIDNDGYCTAQDAMTESGACASTPYPNNMPFAGTVNTCAVRHNAWTLSWASAVLAGLDTDNDTYTDAQETYLGTEPTKACQQNPQYPVVSGGANNEAPLDNWPLDFNDDQTNNTTDIGQYVARLNRAVNMLGAGGQAATSRHDLDGSGMINTTDVGKFLVIFKVRCDAPSAPTGAGFPSYNSQTQ